SAENTWLAPSWTVTCYHYRSLANVPIVVAAVSSRAAVPGGVVVTPGGSANGSPAVPSVVGPAAVPGRGGMAAGVCAAGTAHRGLARVVDPVRADVRVPDVGRTIGADLGGGHQCHEGGHDRQ